MKLEQLLSIKRSCVRRLLVFLKAAARSEGNKLGVRWAYSRRLLGWGANLLGAERENDSLAGQLYTACTAIATYGVRAQYMWLVDSATI